MKREARLLLDKACDSLVLSIELFNRPSDRGRVSSTLIQFDHGFEMLLKAAIAYIAGAACGIVARLRPLAILDATVQGWLP